MTPQGRPARVLAMSDTARKPPAADGTPRRYLLGGQAIDAARLVPGLHIVATPIGNLGDITLRALQTLAGADLIACEDTRVTRKLLDRYGVTRPLTPYHEHNAAQARPALLRRLAEGASIALVSDAGTPLISDPGYKLVRAAQDAGHSVIALPGASAVMAALAVAGLPTDQFLFAGFLPPKEAARRARIAALARIPATLVLFETGPRLAATLADLAHGLGGQREAALCRELTKLHEEIRRGELAALAASYAQETSRGEIVLVVAPAPASEPVGAAETETMLRQALRRVSLKDAVGEVAAATGLPRREVYRRALALTNAAEDARRSQDKEHGAAR
jgi:16S rRNA (cytidine1402-2'-O)-methyltransferase